MANGRLGRCTIPPYTGAEVYVNSSGQAASISIGAQVIDASANTELTAVVGIGSTTLSATNSVSTGSTFCNLNGFNIYGSTYTYCGSFRQSGIGSTTPRVHEFISGSGTVTSSTEGSTCSIVCFGGNEVVSPVLRYDCAAPYNASSALLGFFPYEGCIGFITKCNAPTIEAAAQTLVNPVCGCGGGTGWSGTCYSSCCNMQTSISFAYNQYAFNCLRTTDNFDGSYCCRQWCTCNCTSVPAFATCLHSCRTLSFFQICGTQGNAGAVPCCCNCMAIYTTNTFCYGPSVGYPCDSSHYCALAGMLCADCRCCSNGIQMSPYGVRDARAGDTMLHGYNFTSGARYITGPAVWDLTFLWYCTGSSTCRCTTGLSLNLTPQCSLEFPIKYFGYNSNVCCSYMMIRSSNTGDCGIFSVNETCMCNIQKTPWTGSCCVCCISPTNNTNMYTKVADFPEIMLCSYYTTPLMCVSCLFRSQPCLWTISLYNTNDNKWDVFSSPNLIDWERATSLSSRVSNTLIYEVNSACTCIRSTCNCFMSNTDSSGIIDYKVSANNYERNGVVISNGDRVMVNNNSNKCLAVQVWGYEG